MLYLTLFFESICFPTIVALGMRGLGKVRANPLDVSSVLLLITPNSIPNAVLGSSSLV